MGQYYNYRIVPILGIHYCLSRNSHPEYFSEDSVTVETSRNLDLPLILLW